MENIEEFADFLQELNQACTKTDKKQAEKELLKMYFDIHESTTENFSSKKIKTELILEQILHILRTVNSLS